MAERVVIASVDLDDAPVDAASRRVGASFNSMDRGAKALSDRMFNLRSASMAFLGTFTLAGAVFGLKRFIEDIFKAASGFKEFERSASQARASILGLAADVTNANGTLNDMAILLRSIGNFADALRGNAPSDATQGHIWRFLYGAVPASQLLQILHLTASVLDKSGAAAQNRALQFQGGGAGSVPPGGRAQLPLGLEVPAKAGAEEARKTAERLAAMQREIDLVGELTHGYFAWHGAVNSLAEDFTTWLDPAIEEFAFDAYEIVSVLDLSIERTQLWQETLASGFSLIGNSIADSSLTGRRALALLLGQMAQMSFAFAAMHTAAAFGATTFLGAAITGGTSQEHATAAAQWFAAGVGAAALAGHFGGGGGQSSGFGGAGASPASTQPIQNIQIIFEGNVATDEFMRGAVLDIKKALADGAGGGSF